VNTFYADVSCACTHFWCRGLLFGAEAFGLLGALIAVPLAAALQAGVENLCITAGVEAAKQRQQH